MKLISLRIRVYVPLLAAFLLVAAYSARSAHIPVTGLQANNQGVANWHTTNNVVPEPVGSGHELAWLRGFPPPGQPAGDWRYYSYYYLASPSYGGINPASDSSLLLNNAGAVGFANFFQALADNGFNVADIKVEFGLQSLGADAQGADWTYNAGVEDRIYRNSGGARQVVFKLNGNNLFGGPMPDFHFHIEYNDFGNFGDDNISGFTGTLAPVNMSAGAPANIQAVAAAFIQDVAGGRIRFVFDSVQPEVQIDYVDQANARVGAILEAQSGKIELVPALPIINVGDAGMPEGNVGGASLVFPVNLDQAPAQAVSVDWTVADGSAKAGTDFAAANGTLNLAAGAVQGTISVSINGDMDREPNETFTLTLSNPNGVQLGQAQATGTIQNDDGDFIAIVGVHPQNEGSVAWNAGAGSLEGGPSPTHQQPDGGVSYYWFASPDHDGIIPGSMGGGHGEQPVSGFPATLAALQGNGLTLGDLRIRFGPANLGGHQAGVDYTIAGNIETRIYQGGTYRVFLGNEEILNAPMPATTMTLNFGNLGSPNDDVISGITAGFTPANAAAGASPAAQAVAAALLQDVGGGQLRSVFEGIQPITQTGLNANGRTGAFFSAPVGRLDLLAGPPVGQPDLVVIDAVAREGTGIITFNVSLFPAAAQQVTVDYNFQDDSAVNGSDYTGSSGTLTFAAGETNKTVSFGVVDDAEVEINEQLFVNLGNANGAPIHRSQATGVILDNDFPDFPPVDPEFYPTNTPCICIPLAGIYRTNASEIWHMKLLGTAGLLRVAAVAVSTNDPSTIEALVFNSAGALVGSNQVSYTVPELVAAGTQFYTKWADINVTNQAAGDRLRIEVHNLPPTPQTQTHYRLHGAGVRWMSTPSPSFAGFEADATRWRFLVHSNENLVINYFTNNLPGIAPVDYHLIDPAGNLVQAATNSPIVLANEIVVNNAAPGLWTLAMRAHDHYRISKNSGLDRNIYADWRTGSYADEHVFIKLDGTNAVGTPFDVVLDRIETFGGATNFVHHRAMMTSNGMTTFTNVQQGLYRISVNPQAPGISVPLPQFEIMACDHPLTNVFETFPGGGTNNPPNGPALYAGNGMVVEGDGSSVTLNLPVHLWPAATNTVMVDYATADWTTTVGVDYQSANGTLTFPAGTTNQNVAITVLSDAVLEPTELLYLNLANPVNAAIATPQGIGTIKDNDGPDFPGGNDDPRPYPTNAPCICTPLVGQYLTNSSEIWWIRSAGGPVDLRVIAHSVNNIDPSAIIANVYDAGGALVTSGNVGYSAAEAATNALRYEKWLDLPLGTHASGTALRVEITLGAGIPLTQSHYRLRVCGARWMATPSPSFSGFEADPAQWRLRVHPSDTNLVVNLFTNSLPGFAPFEYFLIDPLGAVVMAGTNQPIVSGPEISVASPMPGLWTLIIDSDDHYRISKDSGLDRALYLDWRTGSSGEIIGQINLNGSTAFGVPFDVELYNRVTTAGGPTNIFRERKLVTNSFFGFHDLFGGTWVVRPLSLSTNIPHPLPQTNLVFCDMAVTNIFNTTGQGGGGDTNQPPAGPLPIVNLLPGLVIEPDAGQTNHLSFGLRLSQPSAQPVSVNFATGNGAASAGSDYVATMLTIIINPGDVITNIMVPVIGDDVPEQLHERFNGSLSDATNAVIGRLFANGVVVDNDGTNQPGPVSFVVADDAVLEGNSGPTAIQIPVLLTRTNNVEVRIDYATRDHNTTAGVDYQSASGTLVFPPGTHQQTVTVQVNGDLMAEPNEWFWVDLSNPVNAVIDTDADIIGAGHILNDDTGSSPRIQRIRRFQAGGPFRLEFDIGDHGVVYHIQASDNLIQWAPIGQVTGTTNGMFEFTDNDSTNRVRRFYRALVP